jgi:hypothetical protein
MKLKTITAALASAALAMSAGAFAQSKDKSDPSSSTGGSPASGADTSPAGVAGAGTDAAKCDSMTGRAKERCLRDDRSGSSTGSTRAREADPPDTKMGADNVTGGLRDSTGPTAPDSSRSPTGSAR